MRPTPRAVHPRVAAPVIDPDGVEWVTIPEACRRARVRRSTIDVWTSRRTIRKLDNRRPVLVAMPDVLNAEHAWRTRATKGTP